MDALHTHFSKDRFARHTGITIVEAREGYAKTCMTIDDHHKNTHGTVHGGALFTIADFTQAIVANFKGTKSVAINVSITYLKGVSEGTITAEAYEVGDGKKIASYRVDIKDDTGTVIAVAQGMSYRKRETIPGLGDQRG